MFSFKVSKSGQLFYNGDYIGQSKPDMPWSELLSYEMVTATATFIYERYRRAGDSVEIARKKTVEEFYVGYWYSGISEDQKKVMEGIRRDTQENYCGSPTLYKMSMRAKVQKAELNILDMQISQAKKDLLGG